ncbi:MAG: hypothetical protein K2G67_06850 [Muribaculaceae bacterium]|nr:hypothetical protein [Muribaculaceae bacterium]
MIIRVPLDDTNSRVSYGYRTALNPISKHPVTVCQTPEKLSEERTASFSDFSLLDYSLVKALLPAYSSSRYDYPVKQIDIVVPDDDKPTVAGWFGNGTGSVASDTLVKRMTAAVIPAIRTFQGDAARIGLFTRPFRLGYALRSKSGKLFEVQPPVIITPNAQSPVMVIREASHSADDLKTVTEIRNGAYELRVSLPPFSLPETLDEEVTEVVFYVTEQCSMMAGNEQVTGVRTYNLDGGRYPGWYYQRLSAEEVRQRAIADSTFRIIGRVALGDALNGITDYRLPDSSLDLTDFTSYPDAGKEAGGDDPEDPNGPGDPDYPRPVSVTVTSEALDLGLPERDKRILSVTARGIFSRHPDSVTFTLYGAHHRPYEDADAPVEDINAAGHWHRIATANGPHIRFLRGIRYRWLKAIVTAPFPARVDALTFGISARKG